MEQENLCRNGRLPNFEVLRTIAMLMVVICHFYAHGLGYVTRSVIDTSGIGLFNYLVSDYVVVVCSVCVNVYVLISSYFLIDKPFNCTRFIRLWMQVVFYSVLFAVIAHFMLPEGNSWPEVINNFTPIRSNVYWFVTLYMGLLLLAPFLSKTVSSLTKSQYKKFICVLVLLGCTTDLSFPWGNAMRVEGGYSLIWFIVLFFVGGYLRRFDINIRPSKIIFCFFILSFATWGYDAIGVLMSHFIRHQEIQSHPIYHNGMSFFLSVLFFTWFKSLKIKKGILTKLLIWLAPYTFGVYLIHDNLYVRSFLWDRMLDMKSYMGSPSLLFIMVLLTISIFLFCVVIDYIRKQLFIMLSIDSVAHRFSLYLQKLFNSLLGYL